MVTKTNNKSRKNKTESLFYENRPRQEEIHSLIESLSKLRELCPKWFSILHNLIVLPTYEERNELYNSIKNPNYDMHEFSRCIIGEAHKFSSSYMRDCDSCFLFSIRMEDSFDRDILGIDPHHVNQKREIPDTWPKLWPDRFSETINKFVDHYTTEHN